MGIARSVGFVPQDFFQSEGEAVIAKTALCHFRYCIDRVRIHLNRLPEQEQVKLQSIVYPEKPFAVKGLDDEGARCGLQTAQKWRGFAFDKCFE